MALLGYGVPGFFLGSMIGRLADRWGRRWLIPAGLGVTAVAALVLAEPAPLVAEAVAVIVLSLGYDMTQPLLAGIVTQLAPGRPGQAMRLNVFCLFTGFGLASLVFGVALRAGFPAAFVFFFSFQAALALLALFLFCTEKMASHFRLVPSVGAGGNQAQTMRKKH